MSDANDNENGRNGGGRPPLTLKPRPGALMVDHAGSAAAAAAAAACMSCALPLVNVPTSSSVFAGLRFSKVFAPGTHSPLI